MFFLNRTEKSNKYIMLKTIVATVMAACVIAFSHGPVAFATSPKLTTIYHVYLNGTYIGNVTDKAMVDQIVSEKIDTMKDTLNGKNLKISSQVQYIPEQVFRFSVNNQQTIQTLKNTFELKAEAAAIVIDGKPATYVENKEVADEVLHKLKLQYVTEDQLNEFEARKASGETTLPPLKENETRILDIRFSKNISVKEENATLEKIMPLDDALTFLQRGTLEEKKYAVQEGDVLGSIAQKNGLKTADILAMNPGITETSLLQIGQEINITAMTPFIDVIVDKEVNQREVLPFGNEVIQDSSLNKGDSKVKQEGQNGAQLATYKISQQNGTNLSKEQTAVQILQQPVNRIVVKGTKAVPSRGEGNLAWPTVGGYVSSEMGYRWGKMHKGLDIARPSSKTIKAADNGVVVSAGWDGGYGNKVVIDHRNGLVTVYAHMASISVSAGQTVSKGSAIGVMGATGDATGVHLHFEVYKNGGLVNPRSYLR